MNRVPDRRSSRAARPRSFSTASNRGARGWSAYSFPTPCWGRGGFPGFWSMSLSRRAISRTTVAFDSCAVTWGPLAPGGFGRASKARCPIRSHCRIVSAVPFEGRVRLRLQEEGDKERTLDVDHVVAGTGYEPDVDRFSFLDTAIRARLRRIEKAPWLSRHFESSFPGLYFVGPVSAFSFGPLFRFVAGVEYTAPALAAHLAQGVRHALVGQDATGKEALGMNDTPR